MESSSSHSMDIDNYDDLFNQALKEHTDITFDGENSYIHHVNVLAASDTKVNINFMFDTLSVYIKKDLTTSFRLNTNTVKKINSNTIRFSITFNSKKLADVFFNNLPINKNQIVF